MDKPCKELYFKKIYLQYAPVLMRFAEKFIPFLYVEDIVHDVFLKLWEKNILIPEKEFMKILFTSVRNACLDHLRKVKSKQKYIDQRIIELKIEELLSFDDLDSDDEILLKKVVKEIEKLPEKRKEILELTYIQGMNAGQIADKFDLSKRTVENQIYRAIIYLKKNVL